MRIPTRPHIARRLAVLGAAVGLVGLGLTAQATAAQAQTRAQTPSASPAPVGLKPIKSGSGYAVFSGAARPASANTLSLQTGDDPGAVSPKPKVYLV